MKFERSKDWWMARARREGNAVIGAGLLAFDPVPEERPATIAQTAAVEECPVCTRIGRDPQQVRTDFDGALRKGHFHFRRHHDVGRLVVGHEFAGDGARRFGQIEALWHRDGSAWRWRGRWRVVGTVR